MALFFDAQWFDTRLSMRGLARSDAAAALGLSPEQIAELWKDQRELSVRDVRVLAGLIGAPQQEVAARAGISTPAPSESDADTALTDLSERLARVERTLIELKALILDLHHRPR